VGAPDARGCLRRTARGYLDGVLEHQAAPSDRA
jgi:hypothetical protein